MRERLKKDLEKLLEKYQKELNALDGKTPKQFLKNLDKHIELQFLIDDLKAILRD